MWTGRPELLLLLLALVARDGGCQEGSDEDDVCVLRSQVDLGLLGEVVVGVGCLGVELDHLPHELVVTAGNGRGDDDNDGCGSGYYYNNMHDRSLGGTPGSGSPRRR